MSPPWFDFLTESCFRVRIAPAAAEKLSLLPLPMQEMLRNMVQDIAEVADRSPPSTKLSWRESDERSLLKLVVGRVAVRYSLSETSRTLAIEHVIVPDEEEGLGLTA